MKSLVQAIFNRLAQWLPSRRAPPRTSLSDPLPREELLGMYFTDANSNKIRHSASPATRERRDGKFSQNRRRG
jgi:hypothetical protein